MERSPLTRTSEIGARFSRWLRQERNPSALQLECVDLIIARVLGTDSRSGLKTGFRGRDFSEALRMATLRQSVEAEKAQFFKVHVAQLPVYNGNSIYLSTNAA